MTTSLRRALTPLLAALALSSAVSARETVPLDFDWKFHLGDPAGAQDPGFDDQSWRLLDLPHDWAFEAPFAPDAAQGDRGGYKPGGIGWYRRTLDLPPAGQGRHVRLEFDGVYMNSQVWLNGRAVGGRAYGYLSFTCDLTPHLQPGRNVIAVRVDNSREPSARWYHGCGVYAPVRLVVTDRQHVAPWGIHITTPNITDDAADVRIVTTLAERPGPDTTIRTRLLDPSGRQVAIVETPASAAEVPQSSSVPRPQRWDTAHPHLYTAVTEVMSGGAVRDTVRTRFGFREIRWEAKTGFHLNGRVVKLLGVSDHLEGGPVGAAVPEKLIRWRLERLRAMGVNAIRTAHNPQVPRFYELCDEMGILVMDELFDGWKRKAPEDYGAQHFAKEWERDLRDWLRRDRNHPSIVIWSVGNETEGEVARDLVRVCHEMDPTRLVTSGHSGSEHMDVLGINGFSEKQGFFRSHVADRPFVATEAPHTWQVRGFYRTKTWFRNGYPNEQQDPFPLEDLTPTEIFHYDWTTDSARTSPKQVFNSSYDNATVRITARKNWELMRDLPWYSGFFRWTGFDYLGEAGYVHGGWPFRAFMGGPLDLAGFEKDLFYFYQSQWTSEPMVHLLPHWTHPTMAIGTKIPVWAYSNAEEIELLLNGRSLGRDRPGTAAEDMQCEWLVPWEPGTIEAVAYRHGVEVARTRQVTAGRPDRLALSSDTSQLASDGHDLAIVTIAQNDAAGVLYPYGENRVFLHLEGPARLISLENGNPIDTEPNWGVTDRRTFFGLVRAFVQGTREDGDVALVAGAIHGERRQLTSNLASIDVHRIALRGTPAGNGTMSIHYTLDGSTPTAASPRYRTPFPIAPRTTVRAVVFEGSRVVLTMEETFSPEAGLHWPTPSP
jgi:beta-galactosidase